MKHVSSIAKRSHPWIAFLVVTLLVALNPVWGQNVTWDVTPGDGATITDGAGTWQLGSGNWNDAGTDVNWANGSNANFGGGTSGTAGTVSLGGDITANRVIFNPGSSGTYTIDLAGNTLGISASNWVTVGSTGNAVTATINDSLGTGAISTTGNINASITGSLDVAAKITGAGRIFALGAGDLTVTNDANDFTGDFGKQNGGNLTFTSIADSGVASAAGAGSEISVGFNANLIYTGGATSTNRTLRLFGNNGALNNSGTGALVLTGTVNNAMNNNQTFRLRGANTDANEIQGAIGDNGANVLNLDKNNTGTWILSGANTYTGSTGIDGGILQANAADVAGVSGALGNGGAIDFAGGTLQYTAVSASTDYSSRISGSTSAISIDTNGQDVTFGTVLATSNIGGLTKDGTGTLQIPWAITYSGATTVNGGTLRLANTTDLNSFSGNEFFINNGSTLQISSDAGGANRPVFNGKTVTFDSNGGGTLNFDNGNVLVQNSGPHIIRTTGGSSNTLSSSRGAFFNMQGTGILTLDVADGTDDVDLDVGIAIGNASVIKSGAGKVGITADVSGNRDHNITAGTLELSAGGRLSGGNYSGTLSNDGVFRYAGNGNQTLSGTVSGTGAVELASNVTLELSGPNTYTGTTSVINGTMLINGSQSLATGALNVAAGATLGGNGTIGGVSTITGTHSPGNSPGIQTFSSDLTYNAGASLIWELIGNTASLGDRGTVFDGINVGGNLDFTGASTVTLSFNGSGSTVDWSDVLWGTNQSWLLYDVAGSTTNLSNFNISTDNWADAQGDLFNTVLAGSSFNLSQSGSDVFLNYNTGIIPEPSRFMLLGLGAMVVLARRRRV